MRFVSVHGPLSFIVRLQGEGGEKACRKPDGRKPYVGHAWEQRGRGMTTPTVLRLRRADRCARKKTDGMKNVVDG